METTEGRGGSLETAGRADTDDPRSSAAWRAAVTLIGARVAKRAIASCNQRSNDEIQKTQRDERRTHNRQLDVGYRMGGSV